MSLRLSLCNLKPCPWSVSVSLATGLCFLMFLQDNIGVHGGCSKARPSRRIIFVAYLLLVICETSEPRTVWFLSMSLTVELSVSAIVRLTLVQAWRHCQYIAVIANKELKPTTLFVDRTCQIHSPLIQQLYTDGNDVCYSPCVKVVLTHLFRPPILCVPARYTAHDL